MTHRLRPPTTTVRSMELDPGEALRLLGTVPLGRVVFLQEALPTVRSVNHILDAGDIVFHVQVERANLDGAVVAYQADDVDLDTGLRWSVVITGHCSLVKDADRTTHRRTTPQPCPDQPLGHVARIHPDLVTGIRLIPAGDTPPTF